MVRLDGQRHIVTALGSLVALHRPAISVSAGDRRGATRLKGLQQAFVLVLARLELDPCFFQLSRCGSFDVCFATVLRVQFLELRINFCVHRLQHMLEWFLTDMTVLTVDGFDLASINSDQFTATEVKLLASDRTLSANWSECLRMIFATICDRFAIGFTLPSSPHSLDMTMRLRL